MKEVLSDRDNNIKVKSEKNYREEMIGIKFFPNDPTRIKKVIYFIPIMMEFYKSATPNENKYNVELTKNQKKTIKCIF